MFSVRVLRAAPLALFCSLALGLVISRAADQPPAAPAETAALTADIAVPPGLALDEVKASVLNALAFRKLTVQDQSEGSITASYARGGMVLILKIGYSTSALTLTVNQWDSQPRVLKTQERWMTNIRKDLTDALTKQKALKK
jgi:hypothetical protein